VLAGPEGVAHRRRLDSRQVCQEGCELGQDSTIRPSVRDKEQERLGGVIPSLQIQSPDHGLDVSQAHLQLDRGSRAASEQDGIPRPLLQALRDPGKRDLDAVRQRWRDRRQETHEAFRLTGIADRGPNRVHTQRRLQSKDRGNAIDIDHRQPGRAPVLDATVVHTRQLASLGNLSLTLIKLKPSLAELFAYLAPLSVGKLCPSIKGSRR
jgi:hypothetical protein